VGTASLGGGRAHTRTSPTGQAAGGCGTYPDTDKPIWRDFNGSRRRGGGYPPTTTATSADC